MESRNNSQESVAGNIGYLTERGIRVRVLAPFILRIFGKKVITLKFHKATSGMLARAYSEYQKCNTDIDDLLLLAEKKTAFRDKCVPHHVYRALACLLVRSMTADFFVRRPVAAWLSSKIAPKDAVQLLQIYFLESGASEFMNLIRWVRESKLYH